MKIINDWFIPCDGGYIPADSIVVLFNGDIVASVKNNYGYLRVQFIDGKWYNYDVNYHTFAECVRVYKEVDIEDIRE